MTVFDFSTMLNVSAPAATQSYVPQASDFIIATSAPPPALSELVQAQAEIASAAALLPVAPFPLDQTFVLHSYAAATKTIYLDFDGFTTRNTSWNASHGLPNIVTQPYSVDTDYLNFSDTEKLTIQKVWERVSEDFRPFDVNVTTEDPGVEALMNSGGTDEEWGIRVVIGGSQYDWFAPTGGPPAGGVAHLNSFSSSIDDPAFVFGGDFSGNDKWIAEAASHEVGHTLGLQHDGQTRFYFDISDPDPTKWDWKSVHAEYYRGHPDLAPPSSPPAPTGAPTSWVPIMGVSYYLELTQWSKGEYPGSDNIEDDLSIIVSPQNGFGYRPDDHGSTLATADLLELDPIGIDSDVNTYLGEGVIELNSDVDYFSFTVEGLGEIISLDVDPFQRGPNLDVLAKLHDASGNVIGTSNPVDGLSAGSSTLGSFSDGGWRVQLDAFGAVELQPDPIGTWQFADELILQPGTYFISVVGTGRPIASIDPLAHPTTLPPPPVPPAPLTAPYDPKVPDTSDWGYSNYGSLGYYSIVGTRKKELVVGVDFDEEDGITPFNWNLFSGGGPQTVLTDLIDETGQLVPYQLTISTSGESIEGFASDNPIESTEIPGHGLPLDGLDGYIVAEDETWNFVWSNLQPSTVYQIYVFGHADFEVSNVVTIVGGQWNGEVQTYNFTQTVSADGLVVNDSAPGNEDLSTLSLLVISNELGEITITVTNEQGFEAALGGLAIAPTKVGSITGQKWNDVNGDQVHDLTEEVLPGWIIYLDLNNDGELNSTSDQAVTVASPDVPQAIVDYTTVKSELVFTELGQITDIDVTLDISHTFDADVNVWLVSPLGTRVKLVGDVGGNKDNFSGTIFDDEASTAITSGTAPFTGHFRPMQALSAIDGESSAGIWQLEVNDDSENDVGVLNSWSISVTLAGVFLEPFRVTDAGGNYSFTNLAPGLYHVREHFQEQQTLDGWRQSWAPSPLTVRSGADVMEVDFGNWIPIIQHGSIQGQKFHDQDGDGEKDPLELGLSGWIVYIDANNNGLRDIASLPTTIDATGLPADIEDLSTVISQVTVDTFGTVFDVEVTLDITHSFVSDLDVYLVSPSGREVELFTGVGGQYNDFHDLTLDDDAARSIATIIDDLPPEGSPYSGTWRPEGLLSDFVGEDAIGIWTLEVRDNAFADEGTLNSWSLTIRTGELFRTTAADGNYTFADLPSGDYIVREESKPGWTQITPATTAIPGADWSNAKWAVTVVGIDNPSDPDGPDSHRNVKNVDFGNQAVQPLAGDFDRSGVVDSLDYIVYRRALGTPVAVPFGGADGDGDGVVDIEDLEVWRNNFGHYIDDHGNSDTVATQVSAIPSLRGGKLEVQGDVDWFAFSAAAGTTYDLETILGTLSDSVLRLFNTDGVTELALNDNAVGLESLIQWTALIDGIYYAEVSGAGSQTGTYDFSISLNGNDDHANSAGLATAVAVPSTTGGDIEVPFDTDWFSFNATLGAIYTFDTSLLTLADSELRLVDQDGTTELDFNDDYGVGFDSHIDWTATASGTYYLEVGGYSTSFGTYDLFVVQTSPGAGSGAFVASAASFLSSSLDPMALTAGNAFSQLQPISPPETGIATTIASAKPGTGFASLFESADAGTGLTHKESVHGQVLASSSQSDTALLAWLSASPDDDGAASTFANHRIASDAHGDDLEWVDAVFEDLANCALAGAGAV